MPVKKLFIGLFILASALSVVAVRHNNRLAFIALQQHEQKREQLQTEWGRLMIERATWTRQNNVAVDAGKRLAMTPPSPEKIVTLELGQR